MRRPKIETKRSVAIAGAIATLAVSAGAFTIGRATKDTAPQPLSSVETRPAPRPASGGVLLAPRRLRLPQGVGR